jgi:hypothetical protein
MTRTKASPRTWTLDERLDEYWAIIQPPFSLDERT